MLDTRKTAGLAVATHFGYYLAGNPDARGWLFYVMLGALLTRMGLHMREWCPLDPWGTFAGALMVWEGVQQFACGLATWGLAPTSQDVCKRVLGTDYYAMAASAAGAFAVMGIWSWQRRK